MPLASRSGTPTAVSDGVTPTQPQRMEVGSLDHQPYIEDSFVNKTAVNPQTYAEELGLLQRYISGSRISVTYFLRSTPTGGLQRSDTIDPSSLRSSVQTSYTEIKKFEIVVQGKGLQSEFNQDSRETKITGEALLYPGMKPRLGDLFITPIGDATFGVFQVMDITRLTYRQGTNHRISFFLREYATEDGISLIRQSVTKTVWFDKETYLGDATTLLKEESYFCLKTLRQMRAILIRYYYNTFYDKTLGSIASPEGVYDPYLVTYLTSKISILESIQRPIQLYPGIQNYENSLWSRLTDGMNRTLIGLQSDYNVVQYRVTRWDVTTTSLVNRNMVALDNPNRQAMAASLARSLPLVSSNVGYVLSANFYNADKTLMTPFEFLVYAVICNRRFVEINEFIDGYLSRYSALSYDDQYYTIPLYLWLIDVAIDGISAPDMFMT